MRPQFSSRWRCARFHPAAASVPAPAAAGRSLELESSSVPWICGFHDVSLRGPALFLQTRVVFPPLLPSPSSLHRAPSPASAGAHTPAPPVAPALSPALRSRPEGASETAAPGRRGRAAGGGRGPRDPGSQTQSRMHSEEDGVS